MNKKKSFNIIYYILFMLTFISIGFYIGNTIEEEDTLLFIVLVLLCYPIYSISIIFHELGHLIFGFISGYSFSSFRVFNMMLLNNNGKCEIKKMSLAGTAGQCIMFPKDDKSNFVLYNLGGIIFNIISFITSGILILVLDNNIIKVLLFEFGMFNLLAALANGIPAKAFVNNDMQNIINYTKDQKCRDNYFNALHIQELIIRGVRLKDIDKKYIYKPKSLDTEGDVTAMVFYCNQVMDKCDFKKAIIEIESVIDNDKLDLLYKGLLINDLLYCYIIEDKDISKVLSMKDKTVEAVLKQMANYPSVIRTNYTKALLIDKDEGLANNYMDRFNKIKKLYPYQVDIDSELELIEIANKHQKKDQ